MPGDIAARDLPVDRAVRVVRAHAGGGGEYHRGERRAECDVHHVLGGHAVLAKHQHEERHHHHAAADAEEAGRKADQRAGCPDRRPTPSGAQADALRPRQSRRRNLRA